MNDSQTTQHPEQSAAAGTQVQAVVSRNFRNKYVRRGGNWAVRRDGLLAASSTGNPWLFAFKVQAMAAIFDREPPMWVSG